MKLSKFLSYILRHNPDKIGILLDKVGFTKVSIDDFISIVQKQPGFNWVDRQIIYALVELDPKGRFEIHGNRIRARYGHSLKSIEIPLIEGFIPEILYHGTNENAYKRIQVEGLKAMGRNKVHLSVSLADAEKVGRRHGGKVVLLEISARMAKQDGINIFPASPTIFVADFIPPRFIHRIIS
ncbi:MAG: RNA 2'-phosphotransferase [Candidatus Helarchaeota archaeon]